VGQEPRRRHDCTVAETDGDRRSGDVVRGENGLGAQVSEKFVGRHLQGEFLVDDPAAEGVSLARIVAAYAH
jgi:hypothetical protein